MAQMNPNTPQPNDPNVPLNVNDPNVMKNDPEYGGQEGVPQQDLTATPRGVNDDDFSAADRDRNPDFDADRGREIDLGTDEVKDTNPDPITGAPGSHPIGTGIGAAAGGAAGAAIGSVIPGAGTVAGGVIGAVVGAVGGGLAGKGIAEAIEPTDEDAYWRRNYRTRPYIATGEEYDLYQPAYQYGWEAHSLYAGRTWDDVEADVRHGWESTEYHTRLSWEKAKDAVRDAWQRAERRLSGGRNKRNS